MKTVFYCLCSLVALTQIVLADTQLESNSLTLEQVIVVAQKRPQDLQNVPITLSVFSANDFKHFNIKNTNELAVFTPGLEANNTNVTQPSYSIRGIGSNNFGAGDEPSVVVYVDGVSSARSGGAHLDLLDIERVEVHQGPQGTLFGRNAAAGVIHLISHLPEHKRNAKLGVRLGSYGQQDFEAMVNVPIGERAAIRASLSSQQNDGIFENGNAGANFEQDNSQSVRASLLWHARDSTQLILRVDGNQLNQSNSPGSSINPAANPSGYDKPYGKHYSDSDPFEERELYGISLELKERLSESVGLTSITAARGFDSKNREDEDGSDSAYFFAESTNIENQNQLSQELRLTGDSNDLFWTLGFTYFQEDIRQQHDIKFNLWTLEQFALGILDAELQNAGVNNIGNGISPANIDHYLSEAAYIDEGQVISSSTPSSISLPLNDSIQLVPYFRGDALALFLDATFRDVLPNPFGLGIEGVLVGTPGATGLPEVHENKDWLETTFNEGSSTSYGAYLDASYALSDMDEISLGIRYTEDQKEFTVRSNYQNSLAGVPLALAYTSAGEQSKSSRWSNWSPRLAYSHRFDEHKMLFLSAAKGYKSGGFNSFLLPSNEDMTQASGLATFDQESVDNIEIGFKTKWLKERLLFNISAYQYNYDGRQELDLVDSYTISESQVLPVYAVRNSDITGSGVQLDFSWLLNRHWLFGGNYSYIDARYSNYGTFSNESSDHNLDGKAASSVPRNKLNAYIQNTLPLSHGLRLQTDIYWNYTGQRTQAFNADEYRRVGAYQIVNFRSMLKSATENWQIGVGAKNLFDETYLYGFDGAGGVIGSVNAARAAGRTFGVEFICRY